MLLYGLALIAVVAARLLRPLVLIRFGNLRNHTIGTFSLQAEGYMADRDLGLARRTVDFFYHTEPRANRVLDRMIERRLNVTPFARYCQAVNSRLPGGAAHVAQLGTPQQDYTRDHYRAYTQTPQHFFLSQAEIAEARRILTERTGMPADAPFICFFSRTSSYLQHLHKGGEIRAQGEVPTTNIRDSSIHTFLPAAAELAQRGFWCFRMGAVVDENIGMPHERVIDYANTFRSELLDLYLISHAHMTLSDTTGLCDLTFMFRRPAAVANLFNVRILHSWGGLVMPKKYVVEAENRLLSLPELLAHDGGPPSPSRWPDYARTHGLRIEDDTAEEIADFAVEALGRLDGSWIDSPEDQARQTRIEQLYASIPLELGGPLKARFAASFLRRHPEFVP